MNWNKPYFNAWVVLTLLCCVKALAFGDDAGGKMVPGGQLRDQLQAMAKMYDWRTLDVGSFDRKEGGNSRIGWGLLLFSFGEQKPVWIYKAPEGKGIPFAALSPDGQQVVFWQSPSFGGRGVSTLYVMELKEGHPRKIAESALPGFGLCWSRDSRKLIFLAGQDSKSEVVSAYLFDMDAKQDETLAKLNLSWDRHSGCFLSQGWSPDGLELVYRVSQKSENQVLVYNLITKASRAIAEGDAPAWSPKGDWIAYETGGYNAGSIRLISPDGQRKEILLQDSGPREDYIQGPILWSPDGTFLLFSRTLASDPVGQLPHVMEVSTRREEELPPNFCGGVYGGSLSWAGKNSSN